MEAILDHLEAHRFLPSSKYTRDCLKFRELNTKWLLLPRWLVSTPFQIYVHQVKSQVHPTLVGDASLEHGPEGLT